MTTATRNTDAPRCGGGAGSFLRVGVGAAEMERDLGFVPDDPAIVPGARAPRRDASPGSTLFVLHGLNPSTTRSHHGVDP
jgi:hypothetical protein